MIIRTNILVVDDENLIRTSLVKLLQKKHNLFSAANGVEALLILENEKIDLIILDLLMPEKNGFEVLKEMKNYLPVIIISAFSGPLEIDLQTDTYPQVIGFIKKPFENLSVLINTIESKYENYIRKI